MYTIKVNLIVNKLNYISINQLKYMSTSHFLNENYQFLQKSKLKTMHFQPSLPRLPIPKLENTCNRYLAALKPIWLNENYEKTIKIVEDFKINSGMKLQKILKENDAINKHTSYISEPWFDMYLEDRKPLPINYNPVLVMKNDERSEYNDQLIRSANIVISALRFMRALHAEYLEPEVFHLNPQKSDTELFRTVTGLAPKKIATYVAYAFKAFPLDMSQYNGLFGATRIPELNKDRIYRNNHSKHILVLRKGNLLSVDVLDNNGNIEPPNVILDRLNYVLKKDISVDKYPLGVLTSADRNIWANLRQHLAEIGNKTALERVDSALFCLCLDDNIYDLNNPVPLVKDCLAGDGTNRWFDKSLSVIVTKDGTTAINFEHSWGDGVAVLRFFNEIYNEITKSPFINTKAILNQNDDDDITKKVNLIEFKLDDYIKKGIEDAKLSHNNIMNSLDMNYIRYYDLNKNLCKINGISPDSIMQLAFQLAYRNLYGKYCSTYESCSTAAFKHGRTETIRPCTMATKEFCENVLKNENVLKLRELIKNCSTIHGTLTKEAAMGQGFDRHLFALKHISEKYNLKRPSLYDDGGYNTINYNILSTSTLSSPGLLAGGFGPVVKDGFGIGYSISNELCGSLVTSYKGQANGRDLIESLKSAFEKIHEILYVKKN